MHAPDLLEPYWLLQAIRFLKKKVLDHSVAHLGSRQPYGFCGQLFTAWLKGYRPLAKFFHLHHNNMDLVEVAKNNLQ